MGKKMFNKNNTGTLPRKVFEAKKAKAQKVNNEREVDEYDDEVDQFIKGKDKVTLNRYDDDDEDAVEPVMDLDIPDSDADEDDEDVDDEDEDDELDFKTKMMLKRFGGGDEDDDNDDDNQDNEEMYDQKWGKGKKLYYNTDVKSDNKQKKTNKIDFDAQDAEDAEEEEAKRLQKKKAALLSANDFDDDLQVEQTLGQRLKANGSAKKNVDSSEQKMLQSVRKDLDAINFEVDDSTTVVESVRKDLSNLTKEEKLEKNSKKAFRKSQKNSNQF